MAMAVDGRRRRRGTIKSRQESIIYKEYLLCCQYTVDAFIYHSSLLFSSISSQEIKYAKPKRGKTATGVWKDIVNIDDYTQTLRMEKCL